MASGYEWYPTSWRNPVSMAEHSLSFAELPKTSCSFSSDSTYACCLRLTHDSVARRRQTNTRTDGTISLLRCMPGVQVIRPADGNETRAAWKVAMETTGCAYYPCIEPPNLSCIAFYKKK